MKRYELLKLNELQLFFINIYYFSPYDNYIISSQSSK